MSLWKTIKNPQTPGQFALTILSIPFVAVVGLVTYPFRGRIKAAQERKKKGE
jgi:hypothetical protein